jgi:acetyl-CoA carboxylase biotin carboxyl carrier protein
MSESGPSPGEIFDPRRIRRLVKLMSVHDLAEIDLKQGELRIRLRRGGDASVVPLVTPLAAAPAVAREPAASSPPQPAAAPAVPSDDKLAVIKSPMVGTFYRAANPESAPFVQVGDHIGPDSTVCLIEAMKVYNEIPAEMSGKVVAILVENGEPVEYGQPLFKVDARG